MSKLELRNIKIIKAMTRETVCYTANLFFNGKKVAELENDGQGGPDREYFPNKDDRDAVFKHLINDLKIEDSKFVSALEHFVGDALDSYEVKRVFDRSMKNGVVILESDKLYTFKNKQATMTQLIESAKKKYPNAVILNTLTTEKAFELFKKHAS